MSEEIKIMFPETEVTLSGETVKVRPFKLGQIPEVTRLMQKIAGPILVAHNNGSTNDINTILGLLADGGENLIQLMAVGIGKPVEFVNNLEQDEAIELICAFIEVNKSFFFQRTSKALEKAKLTVVGLTQ